MPAETAPSIPITRQEAGCYSQEQTIGSYYTNGRSSSRGRGLLTTDASEYCPPDHYHLYYPALLFALG